MTDLTQLDGLAGQPLSVAQLQAILNQIDLDIANVLRDGKLAALKYGGGGEEMPAADRAANLRALLAARALYERLLREYPAWHVSQAQP
ncbi:MAG: hypothetical protein KatS3mg114_1453 [Planctomycetaceae bacterium]|nr:MAG: hypothetical protein KatS3mg114_1453 [Planctomycetaceae bacterium]